MANTYSVGQDDNSWTMDILCSDANGPVDLSAATEILIYLRRQPDNIAYSDGLAAIAAADYAFIVGTQGNPGYFNNPGTSGKNCIARLMGTSAETAVPGGYNGRVQVTWVDGTIRSFPTTNQFFTVNITPRP